MKEEMIIYYYSRSDLVENWKALFKVADGNST